MFERTHPRKAFLIAPPIAVVGYLFVNLARHLNELSDREPLAVLGPFSMALILGSIVAYSFALVFGVPLYFLLKRLGIVSPWVTIGFAALIGALWVLLPALLIQPDDRFVSYQRGCLQFMNGARTPCGYTLLTYDAIEMAVVGALDGLAFWLIYAGGWKRPLVNG